MLNISSSNQAYSNVSFGRKLKPSEKQAYKQTVQKALAQLDKKNLSIIAHGPSFPSAKGEDTGIGSPYTSGALQFLNFANDMGFNSIQLGPSGKTKRGDASPYTSTVFSDNTLFIDLKALTGSKWSNLLSESTFKNIVVNNERKDTGKVNYTYAYDAQESALKEVWENFKSRLDDKSIQDIQHNFFDYKEDNKAWLQNDALYSALALDNGNDYWGNWNELDKNLPKLLCSNDQAEREKAQARIEEITTNPTTKDAMEFYQFCQFIMAEQKMDIRKEAPINTIADIQVTYSDQDWWAFQNLFLDDFSLGVPPDYFSKDGQAWGFPVLDPDQLFERTETGRIKRVDGQPVLGKAGELIKIRFDKMFRDNPGGVRIDHIVGLIDPWVYPKGAKTAKAEEGGTRLFSSPEAKPPIGNWSNVSKSAISKKAASDSEAKVNNSAIDKTAINKYAAILDIIIQSAKDNNVPLANIICEDLGTLTNPSAKVLKERALSGLRVSQFVDTNNPDHIYRLKNVASQHWAVPGTHDNDSMISWTEGLIKDGSIKDHARIVAEDLKLETLKRVKKDGVAQVVKTNNLADDPKAFITAKFAELFASPAQNVQIMFTDIFGMKERYNDPGAKGEKLKDNWRLRIPNNFEDTYSKTLIEGKGLNLPEALEMAMKSKHEIFVNNNKALIKELAKFAEILKQPE